MKVFITMEMNIHLIIKDSQVTANMATKTAKSIWRKISEKDGRKNIKHGRKLHIK